MTAADPLVVCCLPSVFNPKSNGHFIYVDFCASLLGSFESIVYISNDSRYTHAIIGQETYSRYKEKFSGFYMTEQELIPFLTPAFDRQIWLVLPDHIEGLDSVLARFLRDDPHVVGCINVMLAPAYSFEASSDTQEIRRPYSYREGVDFFVFYQPFFSNYVCERGFYIEPLLGNAANIFGDADSSHAVKSTEDRNYISLYLGKGLLHYSLEVETLLDGLFSFRPELEKVLITRSWPPTKKEYNEIIQSSVCLVTFDPLTNVEREALSSGTPVLDVNSVLEKPWLGLATQADELLSLIRSDSFAQIAATYMSMHHRMLKANPMNFLIFSSTVTALIRHGKIHTEYLLPYSPELEDGFLELNNNLKRVVADGLQSHSQSLMTLDDVVQIATRQ
jgi:hypothetical protein